MRTAHPYRPPNPPVARLAADRVAPGVIVSTVLVAGTAETVTFTRRKPRGGVPQRPHLRVVHTDPSRAAEQHAEAVRAAQLRAEWGKTLAGFAAAFDVRRAGGQIVATYDGARVHGPVVEPPAPTHRVPEVAQLRAEARAARRSGRIAGRGR